MSEKDDNIIDNNEEIPQIELPIKTKKPVSLEKLDKIKRCRKEEINEGIKN